MNINENIKKELNLLSMDLSEEFIFSNDKIVDKKDNEPYLAKCLKKTKRFNLYRDIEGNPKEDDLIYYLADKETGEVYEKYYDPDKDFDSDYSANLFMANIKEFLSKFGYGSLKLIGKVRVHGFEYERGEGEFRPVYLNEYNKEQYILAEAEFDIRGIDYRYSYNRETPDDWHDFDTKRVKELVFCNFNSWKKTSPQYPIRKTYYGEVISPFDIQKASGYEPYSMEKLDEMEEIDPPVEKVEVKVRYWDPFEGNIYGRVWVEEKEKIEHQELFERFAKEYGLEIIFQSHSDIKFKFKRPDRPDEEETDSMTYEDIKEIMDEKVRKTKGMIIYDKSRRDI